MKKNIIMSLCALAIIACFMPIFAMDDECIGDECYSDIVMMGDYDDETCDDGSCDYDY